LDIKYLKGVGEKRAEAFNKIGITKLEDFLAFIPRAYLKRININELYRFVGENILIKGIITDIDFPARPKHPTILFLDDGTGTAEIPIYGASEFRSKQFRLNDTFLIWGKPSQGYRKSHFGIDYRDHLKINEGEQNDLEFLKFNYIPVYELSGVLKKTWIKPLLLSKIVFNAFKALVKNNPALIEETIPAYILESKGYISKKDAVLRINFPALFEDIETARKRLSFEELFYLQLLLALKRLSMKNEVKGISFSTDIPELKENFRKSLRFELTNAQKRVMEEISGDMMSKQVMNRLLQGDVGSGKTIVSLFGILIACEGGYQSALMCPTEILAEQHFATLTAFIDNYNIVSGKNFKVTLLIGGQKKRHREELLRDIRLGVSHIIVGTHALFQTAVEYKNLGFVIIDEQHKFGVMQRAKLKEKGLNPDVLVMTATPIPRTLSLTYYGDLDVSVIDELPSGRKPVKTFLREDSDKENIFSFLRQKINEGRQVFIIYPIIDESEKLDLKSAEDNYKNFRENIFSEYKVGIVHGRMLWYEIEEEMNAFKDGKTHILVATTVIEVGIDIPNATIMIIEEAQRFGLSQLHQLRGRVGRGAEQSYCIFIGKNLDEISRKRLSILCETGDGFKIAEADMEIRGPGDFFGIRQSGILNFSCTDLVRDKDLLNYSRKLAFSIIKSDPHLRSPENITIRNNLLKEYKDALYLMNIS